MKAITKRSDNYSRWYRDVISAADLAEHSVVRGCMIIKPYGYAIWEKLVSVINEKLKALGVQNAYFPMFIPEDFLKKEADHIEGFSPELAVVTHGGGKKLEDPLVVRPTSETIIYDSFSRWIQSYRDLPLTINQWANVVRWEMRPRLFLRTTEFLWQEGHTAHATLKEAEEYALMILHEVYADIAENYLSMPVYMGQKSEKEKFAGALRTFCIEALMQDGKSLQAGTSHNLGDNFAKSFDVTFLDKDGQQKNVFQTSWGVSTRLIGGLIMTHSDDKGLVLPPKIAPIQVVIIPIFKSGDDKVISVAQDMSKQFTDISVEVDVRENMRPGEKYFEWEKKGIPVRIEIGPRDLANNSVIVVRRDTGEKKQLSIEVVHEEVRKLLKDIQNSLFVEAEQRRQSLRKTADSWAEFEDGLEKGGYVFSFFCGEKNCENGIKEKAKAVSRFLPFDEPNITGSHKCIHCGKETQHKKRWAFARAY